MSTPFNVMENFNKYDLYCRMGKLNPVANNVVQPVQTATSTSPVQPINKQQPQKDEIEINEKTVATVGILQLVSIGLNKLSQGAGYMFMMGQEFTTGENSVHIANTIAKKNKLNIGIEYVQKSTESIGKIAGKYGLSPDSLIPVAKGQNAFYHDIAKVAVAPATKPSLMLHELGHACNAKNALLKCLQNSRMYAFCVPTVAVLLNKATQQRKDDGPNFIERNAGKIGFLAFLPTIIEEGIASIRGINAAKTAQKTLENIKLAPLIRNYALAWSTYLLAGIGLGIATRVAVLENKKQPKKDVVKKN